MTAARLRVVAVATDAGAADLVGGRSAPGIGPPTVEVAGADHIEAKENR